MKKHVARRTARGAPPDASVLARGYADRAVARLAKIMDGEDDRLAAAACTAILERAFGRPSSATESSRRAEPMEITVRWESDEK